MIGVSGIWNIIFMITKYTSSATLGDMSCMPCMSHFSINQAICWRQAEREQSIWLDFIMSHLWGQGSLLSMSHSVVFIFAAFLLESCQATLAVIIMVTKSFTQLTPPRQWRTLPQTHEHTRIAPCWAPIKLHALPGRQLRRLSVGLLVVGCWLAAGRQNTSMGMGTGPGNRYWITTKETTEAGAKQLKELTDLDEPEEQRVTEATNETSIYEVTARMPCTCGA